MGSKFVWRELRQFCFHQTEERKYLTTNPHSPKFPEKQIIIRKTCVYRTTGEFSVIQCTLKSKLFLKSITVFLIFEQFASIIFQLYE